jgi:hypothetical protein
MAYNPWSDLVVIGPLDQTLALGFPSLDLYARLLSGGNWQLRFSNFLGGYGIASTAVRPFELFGMGCPNSTGLDPRLGWQGLPRQGQSFQIHLRQAEPSGFAFFWLGLSDTNWVGLPLPYDASSLGAPGCKVLVSADVPFPVAIDQSGQASLNVAVPINPSLAGLQLFSQTASTSGANALGFASSDALAIRVR